MRKNVKPVLLVAGGGTGGHIQPAIAIADSFRIRHPDVEIHFCGTERGLENQLVPQAGYRLHPIRARGFPRRLSKQLLQAAFDFLSGRRACLRLIRDMRPFAVAGTGGYVCGPLVSAGKRAGVPILLHEQNAYPGRANRVLSQGAGTVCTSYADTDKYFPKAKKVVWTGNPVREAFFTVRREDARRQIGVHLDEKLIFVMGGSLGAASINQAVLEMAKAGLPEKVRVILAAGQRDFDAVSRSGADIEHLDIHEYVTDTHVFMAAADLLVCRAGAVTCAEIAALSKPSVLIPYPHAAGDHQTYNARTLESAGASVHLADSDLTASVLRNRILDLLAQPEHLQRMGLAAGSLARPDAANAIADELDIYWRNAGLG